MPVKHYQEPQTRTAFNTFPLYYLGVMALLIYSVILVGHSIWQGVQQSKELTTQQTNLDQVKLQIAVQQQFIAYQKTDNYIEKQARQHFGYAKPGESFVILPDNIDSSQQIANEQAGINAQKQEHVNQSHIHQWLDYFF